MANIKTTRSIKQLLLENEALKSRLSGTENVSQTIQNGEAGISVTNRKNADKKFTISSADIPYRLLLEEMDEGAISARVDGTILYCNQRFAEMISEPVEKIAGSNLKNFVTDKEKSTINKLLKRGAKEKTSGLISFLISNEGLILHLKLSIRPLPDGMSGNISIVATDVSQLQQRQEMLEFLVDKQSLEVNEVNRRLQNEIIELNKSKEALRESEKRFRILVKNAPTAILEIDFINKKIVSANDMACTISGYTHEELLSMNALDMLDEESSHNFMLRIERSMKGEKPDESVEYTVKLKDGQFAVVIISVRFQFDDQQRLTGALLVVHEITERRRAELALREKEILLLASEESLKKAQEIAHLGSWELDLAKNRLCWSDEVYKIFGLKPQEFRATYEAFLDAVHPEDRTYVDTAYSESLREGRDSYDIEHRIVQKSTGEIRIVHEKCTHIRNENGKIIKSLGMVHDITDRKKMHEALRESEGRLWSVLNVTQESIYMFDRQGIICMANSTGILRLNKTSEEEIIGHHFSKFMAEDIASTRQEKLDIVFISREPLEFEDKSERRIYHHNYFPVIKDNLVQYVVAYSTDITDRRKAESKLKESERRFRTIAESLTIMISITRICDSTITFINEPYEKAFGVNKRDLIGKNAPDIYCNRSDSLKVEKILRKKGVVENNEIKVKKSDGTLFWIIISIRKIIFMGEPSYLASSIDITETKKAEEKLLQLNRILHAHSKSSKAMTHMNYEFGYLTEVCKIIIEDCGHKMIWIGYVDDINMSVLPVMQFGTDQDFLDRLNITWDETNKGGGPFVTAIRTGKPAVCNNLLTDPDFKTWLEAATERGFASLVAIPLISEGKPFGIVSIYSNEPESFTSPEINLLADLVDDLAYGISFIRLTESEKDAVRVIKENEVRLKELIATKDKFFNIVAHDLKNPFTSLLGSSELLYGSIDEMTPDKIKKLALILNDSAKGGYAILQNLLDWSRSQTGMLKFKPEEINLRTVINENINNFQLQVTNKEISLISELTNNLFIRADKNMINAVLRNLLSNAIKYTFKKGTIVVSVTQESKEILISVRDSGIGIAAELADTLFKIDNSLSLPGTAKEQGTGLGLKLCKEFTAIMGGRIWVESEAGKGSLFMFTIPLCG